MKFKKGQDDWIWICVAVLWERWYPERPSFEMIDNNMQEGYEYMMANNAVPACEIWLEVWKDILNIMNSQNMKTLDDFDQKFRGTQSVYNWVQELEMELGNAAVSDRKFLYERISFCETFLNRFTNEDSLMIENMKRAMAESYFEIGDKKKAESLYTRWLQEDPQWGWGWIGWADCYWSITREDKNYARAEDILKKGLATPGVRDREFILERMSNLYSETDREQEAKNIVQKMKSAKHVKQEKKKSKIKVGRNDPCPCGSGKKYKKCCGK